MDKSQSPLLEPIRNGQWRLAVVSTALSLLAVGVGLATYWALSSTAWRHASAVARIEKHWGDVTYKPETATRGERSLRWKLFGDRFFGQVICIHAHPAFRGTPECKLEDLTDLPELQQLELANAQVSAAELSHLKSLPKLWILNLAGSNVTDVDLKEIEGATQLEQLDLSRTQITDKGLEHLKPLCCLRLLFLEKTRVTDGGARMLRSALPNCQIDR
jgi:hypothetical protein